MTAYVTDAVSLAVATPGTPASGYGTAYIDPTLKQVTWKDSSAAVHHLMPDLGGTPAVADQSITSTVAPGILVTGSSASFPANSVAAGQIIRSTIMLSASSTVAIQLLAKFGTNGTSADATLFTPNAITPTASAPIRVVFEVTFRSSTTAYWNLSGLNNATGINSVGGALSGLTTTSATFFTLFAASASSQTLTVHLCYTEVLST